MLGPQSTPYQSSDLLEAEVSLGTTFFRGRGLVCLHESVRFLRDHSAWATVCEGVATVAAARTTSDGSPVEAGAERRWRRGGGMDGVDRPLQALRDALIFLSFFMFSAGLTFLACSTLVTLPDAAPTPALSPSPPLELASPDISVHLLMFIVCKRLTLTHACTRACMGV